MKHKKVKVTSLEFLEYSSVVPAIENAGLMYIRITSNHTEQNCQTSLSISVVSHEH